jgi:hypothetical protein
MSDMEMLSPEEQEEASRDDRDRYHAWSDDGPMFTDAEYVEWRDSQDEKAREELEQQP